MLDNNILLKIDEITKFFGEHKVLNKASLTVEKGEIVVVLGPSGCGKSTLLRCINGLEDIQGGSISLDGNVITQKDTRWTEIRQKIGMVFQSYDLFPHMTVLQNILLAPLRVQHRKKQDIKEDALKLLERVGLLDKKASYPSELSGGQRQRVAIVRALIMNPEIMLFDEVTAALDPEMVHEVLDVMLDLAKAGMTMVIVTHEMQFAKAIADKIVFMDNGEIVEISKPDIFFNNPQTERSQRFLNKFNYTEKR
ncbi:MAG: amino acid ABC transporter ATP-binding protein [Clostridiales bacterium]|nr:amino acid ABC transporter ATP-binding protein [Clostridiales bacterium]